MCVCVCVDTRVGIIYFDDDGGRSSVLFFRSVRVSIEKKKKKGGRKRNCNKTGGKRKESRVRRGSGAVDKL